MSGLASSSPLALPVHRAPSSTEEGDELGVTVMLRNLAAKLTQNDVKCLLDTSGFRGKFSFVYVPRVEARRCNLGYGFVRFRSLAFAQECISVWHGRVFSSGTRKPLHVELAENQGCAELIAGKRRKKQRGKQPEILVCDSELDLDISPHAGNPTDATTSVALPLPQVGVTAATSSYLPIPHIIARPPALAAATEGHRLACLNAIPPPSQRHSVSSHDGPISQDSASGHGEIAVMNEWMPRERGSALLADAPRDSRWQRSERMYSPTSIAPTLLARPWAPARAEAVACGLTDVSPKSSEMAPASVCPNDHIELQRPTAFAAVGTELNGDASAAVFPPGVWRWSF